MVRTGLTAGALALALFGVGLGPGQVVRAAAQESKAGVPSAAPVNLNTATSADLEKLPGIGPALAARILEYRQKNGGFKKIEEELKLLVSERSGAHQ